MRFTLEDIGDVDVPDGSTVAACRAGLAALTGIDALGIAPLGVDGYPLADGQVAGAEPWVPGCVVRVGAPQGGPRPDPARSALDAPWHLAVLAGPDAGLVAVPGSDGSVHVGRAPDRGASRATTPHGSLLLSDPAVSTQHARVGAVGGRWVIRDLGSANGTWRRAPGRRHRIGRGAARRVGVHRGRRLALGQEVTVGSTVLAVRRLAVPALETTPHGQAQRPRVPTTTWLLPGIVSVALAVLLHSVVPLLFAVTTVVPALGRLPRLHRPATAPARWTWPDLAASAVRGAAEAGARVEPGDADAWWPALRDGLALVGPRPAALARARAWVGAALAEPDVHLTFALGTAAASDWAWCRWVEHRSCGTSPLGDAVRTLLVADGADRATLDRWSLARDASSGVLLVANADLQVPAWCGWTLDDEGRGRSGSGPAARAPRERHPPAAGLWWAEAQSRRVAARDGRLARTTTLLPDRIGLIDLGVPTDAAHLAAQWSQHRGPMTSLSARIGVDATGPTTLDLLTDGPHTLVAGTTGSGKSALLQSLVLDLALRYPPDRLALVLVDFKGGAGLGPCRLLPHVVGEVTDLDASLAARALDGLRRELARREHLLRAAGVADLEALRARVPAPPRVLVVVDELQALREDLPDVLPALIRLAAQGRSLGIHLVLATQRPAGAVDAQVRANVALRLCLRVTDPAESLDVVDVPDAAGLPADRPGRAVVRRGRAATVVEQTAWAALGPATATARWAPRWPTPTAARPLAGVPVRPHVDQVPFLVDLARRVAEDGPPPAPLWSPALPPQVDDAGLATVVDSGPGLPFGLADRPEKRTAGLARWQPTSGALLVVGRPGSGRTTALQAVARSALRAGLTVHLLRGRPVPGDERGPGWTGEGAWGTVADVRDPRRIHRLLHLLRAEAGHGTPEHLLVVDDVGGVLRVLDSDRVGPGAEALADLVRDAARLGIGLVAAGGPAEVRRLLPLAPTRVVLATADRHDDALLGVPSSRPGRAVPGRGVLLPGDLEVQVSVGPGQAPAGPVHPVRATAPGARLRLEPIPLGVSLARQVQGARLPRVDAPAPTLGASTDPADGREDGMRVALGRGGDHAELVAVPLQAGLLVVGPPRSGRSTALATIRSGLTGAALLGGLPRPADERRPGRAPVGVPDPTADLRSWWATAAEGPAEAVLLLDDLDRTLRAHPSLDEVLTEWIERRADGGRAPVLVAATSTDAAAASFRGAVAALRRVAPILVLAPSTPGSTEAAGRCVLAASDPALPRHAGRGVLVLPTTVVPIQVGRIDPLGRADAGVGSAT